MVWTDVTRAQYERRHCRYASDLSDAEWLVISPLLPTRQRLGRPRVVELRDVVNALLYMASTGCQWRMLPKCFPPFTTVQNYFYAWRRNLLWHRLNAHLVKLARCVTNRNPCPTAGIIDSQTVKTTESGGIRGYDATKKIKGRKRHIVTDTNGYLIELSVHAANIQDRHGAPELLDCAQKSWPTLTHIFADSGYGGPQLASIIQDIGTVALEIVKRPRAAKRFDVLPRRWVVERTFAWLGRSRRLAKDFETSIASAQAWILIAHLKILIRRIAANKDTDF